tara:strand:+ start:13405 stop:14184 length:780 start_codon:yes stop_codon:yes gene_type:complete
MTVFKITPEEINQYLTRFEESLPLVIYPRGSFTYKYQLDFVESDIYLQFGLSQIQDINPDKHYKIISGFTRTKLEDFIHFDTLDASGELPMLFNKRLVSKMNRMCPNDFIALPVTIINLSDQIDKYQNTDFYITNPLNTLDIIDKENSNMDKYQRVEKRVYKENPWQGHLMAFEKNIKKMIFHPKLAQVLYPSKQFSFLTPEEDSFRMGGGYPDGHNKDTWSYWMNGIKKTMQYPRPSVLKLAAKQHPWVIRAIAGVVE